MKFTLSWLKEHLETSASPGEISKTLTAVGLEVEAVHDRAESLSAFTVAKILEAEKHPEADKLRVCKVESDSGILQIVCGAPNARAGIFVALAKEGAHIPGNGMVIKKTKIRGVESNGMLCSADELALGGNSEGIIELPEAKIGTPIADVMGLNDPVIEIAITPNRADCLGVRGIARDLAAAGLGTLKPIPYLKEIKGSFASPISVSITTPSCQQFLGVYIRGVKNGESPAWLKQKLEAIGQKSISALVDISNYLTFDLARPMHMYDAKKLRGNIVVRDTKSNDKIKLLNGFDIHWITSPGIPHIPQDTVISDDSGPVALAGIMGGLDSAVDSATTDIFLEIALFNHLAVAKTGRFFQIDSDARYRFERGVDPESIESGANAALSIIKELCGGEVSQPIVAGKTPEWKREINFSPERVKTLGGVDVTPEKSYSILESLGFSVIRHPSSVIPPSWRADVEGEADLVEEILRINGYDNIPATPLPKVATISKPALNLAQKRVHLARRLLASRGFMETCSWSFMPEKQAAIFGGNNPKLKLLNPISADLDMMRPSLIPNLLEAAKKNIFRGAENVQLFEVGLQFTDIGESGQRMVAAGISMDANYRNFVTKIKISGKAHDADKNYTVKAIPGESSPILSVEVITIKALEAKKEAMHVLSSLGVNKFDVTTATPNYYHPGRSGALTLGGKIILGYFGEIHPGILPHYDLEGPVAAFEIFLDAIPAARAKGKAKAALKLSDYQAVKRDFAFIVDEKITAGDIIKAISSAEKNLITEVAIFDVYAGKGVEPGKKSVAVKVTLQSYERTLTEEDINAASRLILQAAGKFGGVLRQ